MQVNTSHTLHLTLEQSLFDKISVENENGFLNLQDYLPQVNVSEVGVNGDASSHD
uniref:Uncharacterized protein n=1 Tax=Solanum tuberosum TaxID=4113 RepID=M1AFV0_SOLTU